MPVKTALATLPIQTLISINVTVYKVVIFSFFRLNPLLFAAVIIVTNLDSKMQMNLSVAKDDLHSWHAQNPHLPNSFICTKNLNSQIKMQ